MEFISNQNTITPNAIQTNVKFNNFIYVHKVSISLKSICDQEQSKAFLFKYNNLIPN